MINGFILSELDDIEVEKVFDDYNDGVRYVKESKPTGGAITVLTYPIVRIRFNINPSSITIINSDNGKIYPKIR